jgi:hypothetical protein
LRKYQHGQAEQPREAGEPAALEWVRPEQQQGGLREHAEGHRVGGQAAQSRHAGQQAVLVVGVHRHGRQDRYEQDAGQHEEKQRGARRLDDLVAVLCGGEYESESDHQCVEVLVR